MYSFNWYKVINVLTGQLSSFGVPNTWKIRVSWSRSDSPGKNGTRSSSSARIQPIAHMSTPVPYCLAPNNSSGDLENKNKVTYSILLQLSNNKTKSTFSINIINAKVTLIILR